MRRLTNVCWSPRSPNGWRRISPSILKSTVNGCVICTLTSIPWNVWKSFVTCVWASLTCWWVSTFYVKVWTCLRSPWWRFWTQTKKGSCVLSGHLFRPSVVRRVTSTVRRFSTAIKLPPLWLKRLVKPNVAVRSSSSITKNTVLRRRGSTRKWSIFWRWVRILRRPKRKAKGSHAQARSLRLSNWI